MSEYTKVLEFFIENNIPLNESQTKSLKERFKKFAGIKYCPPGTGKDNDYRPTIDTENKEEMKKLGSAVSKCIKDIKTKDLKSLKEEIDYAYYNAYGDDYKEYESYFIKSDRDYQKCIKCEQNYNDRGDDLFQVINLNFLNEDSNKVKNYICGFISNRVKGYLSKDPYFKKYKIKVGEGDLEEGCIQVGWNGIYEFN